MAPLVHLLALFALTTAVLASPHISRGVYNHAHRAVAHPAIDLDARSPLAPPKRKRSLNKRCAPRPTTNSTTSALPTSTPPTSTAPLNVAPGPSAFTPSAAPSPPAPSSATDTTSSTPSYVAPTSSPEAPPTSSPTTSSTPAPTSTPATSSSSSSEPSYMTGTQTGQGTYYEVGLGACGITSTDGQAIAAVSEDLFDSYPGYDGVNPNTNPVCGKQITASYGGSSVTVTVYDRCTGCALTDLDFSPTAFGVLADASLGRIDISWEWKS